MPKKPLQAKAAQASEPIPQSFAAGAAAWKQFWSLWFWITAALMGNLALVSASHAQAGAPAQAASAPDGATERAQRQSDNVYKWIKYFADQPRRVDPTKTAPKSEPSAPVVAKKPPAAKAVDPTPEPETLTAAPVSAPAPASVAPVVLQPPPVAPPPSVAAAAPPADPVIEADRPLVPVSIEEPTIPRELGYVTLNHSVVLSFTVQPDGSVTAPNVVRGTHRRLNKAAMDAVVQWRFEPIGRERTAQIEFEFKQD